MAWLVKDNCEKIKMLSWKQGPPAPGIKLPDRPHGATVETVLQFLQSKLDKCNEVSWHLLRQFVLYAQHLVGMNRV